VYLKHFVCVYCQLWRYFHYKKHNCFYAHPVNSMGSHTVHRVCVKTIIKVFLCLEHCWTGSSVSKTSRKCVIPVVCVKIGKGMLSNTTMSIKVYLVAMLDNYMFRPLLAIFRLSSRELKVLLYTLCAHVVQRSLHRALLRNVISICGGMLWLEAR